MQADPKFLSTLIFRSVTIGKSTERLLAAVPDSYGISLFFAEDSFYPLMVNGKKQKEIAVARISNNIWTELGKLKIPVNSLGSRFEHAFYFSRKLFLVQKDPVCLNCRGKQISCGSPFVCQDMWTSGIRSQTIIELDYKKDTSQKMEIFPFTQHLFNYLDVLNK